MEEGEVEEKRVEKEEDGMAVCSKQRTVTIEREACETWNMSGVCGEACTLPRDRYGGIPASGM